MKQELEIRGQATVLSHGLSSGSARYCSNVGVGYILMTLMASCPWDTSQALGCQFFVRGLNDLKSLFVLTLNCYGLLTSVSLPGIASIQGLQANPAYLNSLVQSPLAGSSGEVPLKAAVLKIFTADMSAAHLPPPLKHEKYKLTFWGAWHGLEKADYPLMENLAYHPYEDNWQKD